jgi:acetyl-CoA acetyltransferase
VDGRAVRGRRRDGPKGYAGYVAGASIAQALGWTGARVATSYGACASGSQALDVARARILAGLCDVALVVGADTTPKGFLAPNAGDRPDDPDWLRFRLLGATNPAYFRWRPAAAWTCTAPPCRTSPP